MCGFKGRGAFIRQGERGHFLDHLPGVFMYAAPWLFGYFISWIFCLWFFGYTVGANRELNTLR